MLADKTPVFRKVIIPWYNSTTVLIMMIGFMLLVFLFAAAGIAVARETPAYRGYVWVPAILLAMSAAIIATTAVRLIRRYTQKSIR